MRLEHELAGEGMRKGSRKKAKPGSQWGWSSLLGVSAQARSRPREQPTLTVIPLWKGDVQEDASSTSYKGSTKQLKDCIHLS